MVGIKEMKQGFGSKQMEGSRPEPAGMPVVLIAIIWLLIIVKLFLTANEEIIARSLPHDDLWQVMSASRGYWGGAYTWSSMLQRPVFPLFIRAVASFGVPLRIALELLYCAAAYRFCVGLWRLRARTWEVCLSALLVILHPASFQLPNRCGPEVILTPLILLALGYSFTWWAFRGESKARWDAAIAACLWAVAWNTRKESVVFVGVFSFFLFCLVWEYIRAGHKFWPKAFEGVLVPVFVAIALSIATKTANFYKWGVFADSVLETTGYKAAYRALQSIPPPHYIPYIPVSKEVRDLVYMNSPTFLILKSQLEGDVGRKWARISRESFTDLIGMRGLADTEIAAGWFYWALIDSAVASGNGGSAKRMNDFFEAISKEIVTAQKAGALPKRSVPITFVDPEFWRWIPRLFTSSIVVAQTLVAPAVQGHAGQVAFENDADGQIFDLEANRRVQLVEGRRGSLSGWAKASNDIVSTISIEAPGDGMLGATVPSRLRPDIDTVAATGFAMTWRDNQPEQWRESKLVVQLATNGRVEIPLRSILVGHVASASAKSATVNVGVDVLSTPIWAEPYAWGIQTGWADLYYKCLRNGVYLIPVCLIFVMIRFLRSRTLNGPLFALLTMIVLVVSRLLLFSVLDATSWPGNQPRYLYPVMPEFVVAMLFLFTVGGAEVICTVKILATHTARMSGAFKGAQRLRPTSNSSDECQ